MPEDDFFLSRSKIAIIGLGLMGGSLALALKGKCAAILGIDLDPATLELALRQSIVDRADRDPANLLPEADIVILSVPVPAILSLIKKLPSLMPNPCVVLDLGSTKRQVIEAMNQLPRRFEPIGGHPLCGKEKLSLANAERTLFYAAPFLLTLLKRTTPHAVSAATEIIEAIGAKAVTLSALEHDHILAHTSHLPFLLSSALALSIPNKTTPLIGPGFKSTSRLAGTPASMMLGILQTNRENVLEAISGFQQQLAELEAALVAEDYDTLEGKLNQSQSRYNSLLNTDHR